MRRLSSSNVDRFFWVLGRVAACGALERALSAMRTEGDAGNYTANERVAIEWPGGRRVARSN